MTPPSEPTRAVYVRMPDKLAQKLDQAAERFGVSKRDLLSTLVSDHLDIEGDEIVFRPHGRGGRAHGESAPAGEGTGTEEAGTATDGTSRPSFRKEGGKYAEGSRPPWPADMIWRRVAGVDPFSKTGGAAAPPPPAPASEVLTLAEAAELLRVTEDDVRTLVESGELPARKIGEQWRLTRTAVLAWLASDGTAGA